MKLKIYIWIIILAVAVSTLFIYFNKQNAWETFHAWSGVKTLPTWAKDKKIKTSGSSVSRTFTATFTGTKEEIDSWVATNGLFKGFDSEPVGINSFEYTLTPQEGAESAKVTIDYTLNQVTIVVSAS